MPHLQSLTVTDIDPLCYPDDIASVLFGSPKLDTLKLHWSPRMRDVGEPSIHLHSYFRHNIAAKKKLKMKHIGFYNLFALTGPEIEGVFDYSNLQSMTMLNSFGSDETASAKSSLATFIDGSWTRPPEGLVEVRSVRHDKTSKKFGNRLSDLYGLEKIYLVNARHIPSQNGHHPPDPSPTSISTTSSNHSEPQYHSSESAPCTLTASSKALRDLYLDVIISNHGPTLKHLILPDRWPLPNRLIARLFNACPNITQLALAVEFKEHFAGMRLLLPFLKKIWAVRILMPSAGTAPHEDVKRLESVVSTEDEEHEEQMGRELAGDELPHLKYVGMGWKVFELGGLYQKTVTNEDGQEETVVRRRVKRVDSDVVKDVEIWKMDSLDVV